MQKNGIEANLMSTFTLTENYWSTANVNSNMSGLSNPI